jgi:hypothetical protein
MQVGAKAAKDRAELSAKQELEGLKVGAEIARNKAMMGRETTKKGS